MCTTPPEALPKFQMWHFGLPLTYAYATLRQIVAGNLQFRGIVFCNLGTSKTVISKFVTTRQILVPHILPHVNMTTPKMFPWDKKESIMKKSHPQKCINSFVSHKLSHDHWLWFFFGIWWCLQTGGGGVATSWKPQMYLHMNVPCSVDCNFQKKNKKQGQDI